MRCTLLKSMAGCLLAAACAQACAASFADLLADFRQVKAEGKTSHLLDIENDTLLLNHSDGFYTSGMRYTQQYGMRNTDRLTIYGWRIGQELYTTLDIKIPPALVGPPDHPYAAWLYGGFFKETHLADGTHVKWGIDAGCIGPCAGGEWVQTNLHRLLHQPLPRGWSKQVNNELGVVLHAESAPTRWMLGSAVDVTPLLHGRFGNIFTDAGAGVTVRAGQLNQLPDQAALHGFLRIDSRAVGHNATLQGGYFSSQNPHTVAPKRWVGEAEIGVFWSHAPYGASASVVRRSNEISALSNAIGAQNFARLQFVYTP